MAGYTPAFDSIYTGTLYGKWPTAAVWASLLPLFDRHGNLDMSLDAIAGMTGWPRDLLEQGITALTEPDPGSRTGDHEGRRLVRIDPERPWGWKAVNHGKYREKARKMAWQSDQTASGLDAERKARERATHINVSGDVQTSPAKSGESSGVPLSDGDGDIVREAPAKKRGPMTPVPENFSLTEAQRRKVFERYPDADPDRMVEGFIAYHKAKATLSASWPHSWATWVSKAEQLGYPKRSSGTWT